ncbi:MAG: YitT family protein [Lactobacillus sp.]|nr:YitT family protein [Lactobacillus sp.]
MKRNIRELFMIALGCAIYAFSLDLISVPNKLADGGISGITLMLRHFFNINMGVSTIVLNLPLFLLGYHFMNKKQLIYTIWGTACLSFFLYFWKASNLIPEIDFHNDLFLSAISAGTLSGLGLGTIFRFKGTSGGTDILAKIAQLKFGISSGKVILMLDVVVLGISLSYLDATHMMYTILASYILAKVMDFIQEGAYTAKGVLIISDDFEKISKQIDEKMERGLTYFQGYGGYKMDDKHVIYVVVSPREIPFLKEIIFSIDPNAFVSIMEVHEAYGEGFTYGPKPKTKLF